MFRLIAFIACLTTASAACAGGFTPYHNSRFNYSIDLPSDFTVVLRPENGDGMGLESVDGAATLSVWGNYITEGGFRAESDLRQTLQADEGWTFSYQKRGASWASFSGVKGKRIIYMRQIALCDDAMGNFTIEYPARDQKRYGPVIDRLVKSLKAPQRCE